MRLGESVSRFRIVLRVYTLKLDSAPAGTAVVRAAGKRKSPCATSALRLPAGISNLAIRDKEAAIFRTDLALNRECALGTACILFLDEMDCGTDFRLEKRFAVIISVYIHIAIKILRRD